MTLDRIRLAALVDYLAAAVVASLPWSTSATSILVALWVIAVALALDGASLRRVGLMPAAALPIALVLLAVAGVLWAGVAWPERLAGVVPFLKLLVIPLLFMHFGGTGRGEPVLIAFFASACVLLALSWLLALIPQIPWSTKFHGVPVKDYIIQSGVFALCSFALADRAIAVWGKSHAKSVFLVGVAFIFMSNIVFVALGRTSLVVIAVLFALFGIRHFKRRALAAFVAAGLALAAVAWSTSPYLRFRVMHIAEELDGSRAKANDTSAGLRVGFWKMSLSIVRDAPLFGHGTGSTQTMLVQRAAADPAAPTGATNPHNQILATAIPLGLCGVALLLAMWIAHFRMFLYPGHPAWIGLSVVAQNFVGSLFNSHLFDFTQGWLYVFGVGIAGGIMLREHRAFADIVLTEPNGVPAPAKARDPVVQAMPRSATLSPGGPLAPFPHAGKQEKAASAGPVHFAGSLAGKSDASEHTANGFAGKGALP
jgi:O-antigen ligase